MQDVQQLNPIPTSGSHFTTILITVFNPILSSTRQDFEPFPTQSTSFGQKNSQTYHLGTISLWDPGTLNLPGSALWRFPGIGVHQERGNSIKLFYSARFIYSKHSPPVHMGSRVRKLACFPSSFQLQNPCRSNEIQQIYRGSYYYGHAVQQTPLLIYRARPLVTYRQAFLEVQPYPIAS